MGSFVFIIQAFTLQMAITTKIVMATKMEPSMVATQTKLSSAIKTNFKKGKKISFKKNVSTVRRLNNFLLSFEVKSTMNQWKFFGLTRFGSTDLLRLSEYRIVNLRAVKQPSFRCNALLHTLWERHTTFTVRLNRFADSIKLSLKDADEQTAEIT